MKIYALILFLPLCAIAAMNEKEDPMTQKGYYFLASPFNGDDSEKQRRYNFSKKIAALFLERNISLFAPIIYNQALIDFFPSIGLEDRRKLLMPMNVDFLLQSKGMILFKLEGWDQSWGLKHYLEICEKEKIPVYELFPENLEEQIEKASGALAS